MKKIAALLLAATIALPMHVYAVGAIAVDDQMGEKDPAWGVSTGEESEAAAKKAALKYCKENGDNCKVVAWFKTCGAYASSAKYYGYGWGDTKAIATKKALEMCGQNSCKVVVAECEE